MNREEIIKGLECCQPEQLCLSCPYNAEGQECCDVLLRDAAELLKAEAPKVLTPEELMGFDGAFLIEYNISFVSLDPIWATFHYMDEKWVFLYKDVVISHYSVEQYGRTWRCWSRRPTPEQMEATPWPGT